MVSGLMKGVAVMKTLRRFTTSIVSSFDSVVGQLENHEALVSSAIRDAEQAAGRAKAQFQRVQKDGVMLRPRLEEVRDGARLWEERAKRCAEVDEAKALECLRRREALKRQTSELDEQTSRHTKLEKQLSDDLLVVQDKLSALRQQRNILRTRQSRAEALRLVQGIDSGAIGEIDDIFDRWEARIGACEESSRYAHIDLDDNLATEFQDAEVDAHLRSLLRELTSK